VSEEFQPILIIAGLTLCCFGWVLYWAGLRLFGAACGAVAGAALAGAIVVALEADQWMMPAAAVMAILGAFAGVYLITRAHYLLFFVTGGMVGVAIAYMFEPQATPWLEEHFTGRIGQILYYVLASVAGGSLILVLHRWVVITLTSFAGTGLFVLGIPTRYALWLALPVLLGSFFLQSGVLAALGHAGEQPRIRKDEPEV
jgi:hypothetical protein